MVDVVVGVVVVVWVEELVVCELVEVLVEVLVELLVVGLVLVVACEVVVLVVRPLQSRIASRDTVDAPWERLSLSPESIDAGRFATSAFSLADASAAVGQSPAATAASTFPSVWLSVAESPGERRFFPGPQAERSAAQAASRTAADRGVTIERMPS